MHKSLGSMVLLVSMAAAAPAAAAQPESDADADADVRDAVKAYDTHWERKDLAALERVLADDYVYFSSKGDTLSRQVWLGRLSAPQYVLKSSVRSEIEVHRIGDAAVVGTRWKGHGEYEGTPFVDDQRCSLVLGRSQTAWKVLSEHCTQIVDD